MSRERLIASLLLAVGCTATVGLSPGVTERAMGGHDGRGAQVRCSVTVTEVVWQNDAGNATIWVAIHSNAATQLKALPSIRLVTLPKKEGLERAEYWAPFDITDGRSARKTQTFDPGTETFRKPTRLAPSQLLWASTKSSVWPSREFAKTVPSGRYALGIQLELDSGETLSSNEIEITVKK